MNNEEKLIRFYRFVDSMKYVERLVEYRIPQTPDIDEDDEGEAIFGCPNCYIELDKHYGYCPQCGQALDWENEVFEE